MKISFVFPSRERPSKFFKTLDNLKEFVIREDYEVVCVLDIEDETMNNDAVKERAKAYPQAKLNYTHTTGKVNAINKGLEFIDPEFDILILIADDIEFTMKGFDYEIECDMQKYAPKLDFVIHYPDQVPQSGRNQITMPVLGHEFINYFGWIYEPSFKSVWCDTYMLKLSKRLNKHKFIDKHLYLHNHPIWLKQPYDELMKRNESLYQEDSITYFKLIANDFSL
jgi:hypothetical protein